MMLSRIKLNRFFKTAAVFAAAVILCNQVVWGQDAAGTSLPGEPSEKIEYMTPKQAENQWTILRNLINRKQAILDFVEGREEPQEKPAEAAAEDIFTIVTEDGSTVHYAAGRISGMETSDGTVVDNLILDADGGIVEADVNYADGVSSVIRDGKVREVVDAEGTRFNYDDAGLLTSVEYPNGATVSFAYVKNTAGDVIQTILTDKKKHAQYDTAGKLKKVEYNIGIIADYEDGVLSRITETNGTVYIYEKTTGALSEIHIQGNTCYVEDEKVTSMRFADGTVLSDIQRDEAGHLVDGLIQPTAREKIATIKEILSKIRYADR